MRHGLMLWREDELSGADVLARQHRLQAAMRAAGLDAVLIYTNHVRSAGVTYLTGFTPYWSDALLLVPADGPVLFSTALSKRVGDWIASTNPTAEIAHSPKPGELVGKRMAAKSAASVGVLELDRMPAGLVDEIASASNAQLSDCSALFEALRSVPDAAETTLVAKADDIVRRAFATAPAQRSLVGDVTEALELAVRRAGAEECYVAIAPDLSADTRLARAKGSVELGRSFAIRLSIAYNGVWIRRTETLARAEEDAIIANAAAWADGVAKSLDLTQPLASQLSASALPSGLSLSAWSLEAPLGTRPLELVASSAADLEREIAYGVLALRLETATAPIILARPIGAVAVLVAAREVA